MNKLMSFILFLSLAIVSGCEDYTYQQVCIDSNKCILARISEGSEVSLSNIVILGVDETSGKIDTNDNNNELQFKGLYETSSDSSLEDISIDFLSDQQVQDVSSFLKDSSNELFTKSQRNYSLESIVKIFSKIELKNNLKLKIGGLVDKYNDAIKIATATGSNGKSYDGFLTGYHVEYINDEINVLKFSIEFISSNSIKDQLEFFDRVNLEEKTFIKNANQSDKENVQENGGLELIINSSSTTSKGI